MNLIKKYPLSYLLIPGIAFFLVFIIRFSIASNYSVNLPFWDQWDTELKTLLDFKNNTLTFDYLFAPHNEHRIFFAKIFWILIYVLNGSWNLVLESEAQTIFVAITASLFSFWLIKDTERVNWISQILIIFLFAAPIDVENISSGFQIQFYFLFIFIALGIRVAAVNEKITFSKILLLSFLSLCAFFSMAAGALLPVLFGLCLLYYWVKTGLKGWKLPIFSVWMFLLFVLLFYFIPVIPGHQALKIHSIGAFLNYIFLHKPQYLLFCLPIVIFILYSFYNKTYPGSKYNFAIFLYAYYAMNFLLCVYQRNGVASRYEYLFLSGILGGIFLFDLVAQELKNISKILNFIKFPIIICLVFMSAISLKTLVNSPAIGEQARKLMALTTREAITIYKDKGYNECLKYLKFCQTNLPWPGIPYPSADRLAILIAEPAVSDMLPKYLTNNPLNETEKKLLNSYEPVLRKINIDEIKPNMELISCNDVYDNKRLQGWAYMKGINSISSALSILIRDPENNCFSITSRPIDRPDVSKHFNAGTLYDKSGFNCDFSNFEIPPGKYQIGILVTNGNKSAISWTDKYYEKKW